VNAGPRSEPKGRPRTYAIGVPLPPDGDRRLWAACATRWTTCVELDVFEAPGRTGVQLMDGPWRWPWGAVAATPQGRVPLKRHDRGARPEPELAHYPIAFDRPPAGATVVHVQTDHPADGRVELTIDLSSRRGVRLRRPPGCATCGALQEHLQEPGRCPGCDALRESWLDALTSQPRTELREALPCDLTLRSPAGVMRVHAVTRWSDRVLVHLRHRGGFGHLSVRSGSTVTGMGIPRLVHHSGTWSHWMVSFPHSQPLEAVELRAGDELVDSASLPALRYETVWV